MRSPANPNLSSPYFLVRITEVIDAGADLYGFQEAWLIPDGTFADKAGGRYASSDNPAQALPGTSFSVGDYALARSADGAGGLAWELVLNASAAGGGGGGGAGCCGWVADLLEGNCLRVSIDGEATDVYLTTEDGTTWTSADSIAICGTAYFLTITKSSSGLSALLTNASGSGTSYTGIKACCGVPWQEFAFSRRQLCPDAAAVENCANIVTIRVQCKCPTVTTVCCPDLELPTTLHLTVTPPGGIGCVCLDFSTALKYRDEIGGGNGPGWVGVAALLVDCEFYDAGTCFLCRLQPVGPFGANCWKLSVGATNLACPDPDSIDFDFTSNYWEAFATFDCDSEEPFNLSGNLTTTGSTTRPCNDLTPPLPQWYVTL